MQDGVLFGPHWCCAHPFLELALLAVLQWWDFGTLSTWFLDHNAMSASGELDPGQSCCPKLSKAEQGIAGAASNTTRLFYASRHCKEATGRRAILAESDSSGALSDPAQCTYVEVVQ